MARALPFNEAEDLLQLYITELLTEADEVIYSGEDDAYGRFLLDLARDILQYRSRRLRFFTLQTHLKKVKLKAYLESLK